MRSSGRRDDRSSAGAVCALRARGPRPEMILATPRRPLRAMAAFEWISIFAGGVSALIGVLVLVGWSRGIDGLRTIVPGLIPTIPNTAVAFIIGGLAVMSASRERYDERFVLITRVLAVALTALGALFLDRAGRERRSRRRPPAVRRCSPGDGVAASGSTGHQFRARHDARRRRAARHRRANGSRKATGRAAGRPRRARHVRRHHRIHV